MFFICIQPCQSSCLDKIQLYSNEKKNFVFDGLKWWIWLRFSSSFSKLDAACLPTRTLLRLHMTHDKIRVGVLKVALIGMILFHTLVVQSGGLNNFNCHKPNSEGMICWMLAILFNLLFLFGFKLLSFLCFRLCFLT